MCSCVKTGEKYSCCILNQLEVCGGFGVEPRKEGIAVIKTGENENVDEFF